VNPRCIRGICMTNSDCLSITRDGGLVHGESSRFFCSLPSPDPDDSLGLPFALQCFLLIFRHRLFICMAARRPLFRASPLHRRHEGCLERSGKTIGPYLRYRNLVGKDDKQDEKIEALAG